MQLTIAWFMIHEERTVRNGNSIALTW